MKSTTISPKLIRFFICFTVIGAFLLMFLPFWRPMLMASLFAFALVDWVKRIGRSEQKKMPAILILIGLMLMVVVPIVFVVIRFAEVIATLKSENLTQTSFYLSLQKMMVSWQSTFESILARLDMAPADLPQPTSILTTIGGWFVDQSAGFVSNVPDLIVSLFIFTVTLFYFLTESKKIHTTVLSWGLLEQHELDNIIDLVKKSSYSTLIASAVIGAIQAVTVSIGGLIFGYHEFAIIFILTFFASFVPVIGAAPVAAVLGFLSLANGEIGSAVGLFVVATIAGSIDNIVKPFLFSSQSDSDMHPLIALIAIIGAVMVYGLPGLLLGPILLDLATQIAPLLGFVSNKTASKE